MQSSLIVSAYPTLFVHILNNLPLLLPSNLVFCCGQNCNIAMQYCNFDAQLVLKKLRLMQTNCKLLVSTEKFKIPTNYIHSINKHLIASEEKASKSNRTDIDDLLSNNTSLSAISDPLKHLPSMVCINYINVNIKMFVSMGLQQLLD